MKCLASIFITGIYRVHFIESDITGCSYCRILMTMKAEADQKAATGNKQGESNVVYPVFEVLPTLTKTIEDK